jgi:two-component system sensor histidine kinase PilS (NtrC family)
LLYALTYPFFKKRPGVFGGVQILLDIGLESAVIYVTGGKESPFVFLYALSIISSNIILARAAGYGAAALSSLVYLSIVLYSSRSLASAEPGGFFKSQTLWLDAGLAYALFEVCGFLLVALLSGYLSERLRLTRDELGDLGDDLRFFKNLNENILQSLTSGLVTLDLQGKIISLNRAAFEILGIDRDGLVSEKKVEEIIPDLNLREAGLKKRKEANYKRADGKELILGFSSAPLRDTAGKMCGHIITFQDLTELKELERQVVRSEKMAMIG